MKVIAYLLGFRDLAPSYCQPIPYTCIDSLESAKLWFVSKVLVIFFVSIPATFPSF